MSDIAIKCEQLSKRYRIGEQEHYKTLRDVIADTAAAPFRRLRSVFANGNGNAEAAGSSSGASSSDPGSSPSNTIWALDDVSFEVKRGEIVGLIGRNGAGKSTLLKILSRITKPTKGHAEIHGRVGSLLEVGTGFHPELTGRENIYLNGAILGMRRAEIERKFDEIVAFAEVERFIDTPVKRYSSGMYVRLAFAVAAHMETEILLVDEVLAVGDAQFQKKCLGKIGDVARHGRTVLFVSHNMSAIQLLCSRAVRLGSGRVVGQGPAREQVEDYLKVVKNISVIKWNQPLKLGPNSQLNNFEIAPNPTISGAPLKLLMEIESSVPMRINELAVLIQDSLGRRISILDLRSADGYHRTNGNGSLNFEVDVASFPMVEGDYYLGLWVDSDDVIAEFRDLLSLTVTDDAERREIITYPPHARGSVELDYRVRA
jgi:lipopolysaccharide transport system ATP-binding protein